MTTIFQCGFIRSCLLRTNKTIHSSDINCNKFNCFLEQFQHIDIDQKHFQRKSKEFSLALRKRVWHGEKKEKFMKAFSLKTWKMLSFTEKKKHSLHTCVECLLTFAEEQELFPEVSRKSKKIQLINTSHNSPVLSPQENTPPARTPEIETTPTPSSDNHSLPFLTTTPRPGNHSLPFQSMVSVNTPSIEGMKESAKAVLKDVTTHWNKIYTTPFTKILTEIPECNITEKISNSERKKELRKIHKRVKESIETSWKGTDTTTLYGTRQSKSRYEKHRASLFFETKAEANDKKTKTGRYFCLHQIKINDRFRLHSHSGH